MPARLPTDFESKETKQTRCKTHHTQKKYHNRKKDKSVHVHILCFRRPIGCFGFFFPYFFPFFFGFNEIPRRSRESISQLVNQSNQSKYNMQRLQWLGKKKKGRQDNEKDSSVKRDGLDTKRKTKRHFPEIIPSPIFVPPIVLPVHLCLFPFCFHFKFGVFHSLYRQLHEWLAILYLSSNISFIDNHVPSLEYSIYKAI